MLAIHQNGTSTISTKTTRPTTVTTRTVIGFAVGAPAQGSGARRSAREPACSLDLPSGRLRRAPAPDGRPENPRAHWICRRGACAGLRRPTVGQRTRVLIGFAVGAPAQASGARRSAREPACSLDLPSGRLRRPPAPDGRPENPRAHWICRRGACAGLRRPTVGQRTRVLIGFAVGAPAQASGARRSAREPACSLDLPSGRLRRPPAPDGRPENPRAHWICRRGACAGLRRPTVGQRTRVLIGFAVGAPAQASGAR